MNNIIMNFKYMTGYKQMTKNFENKNVYKETEIPESVMELIKKIENTESARKALNIMFDEVKKGELEVKNGVLFKKDDFVILNSFQNQGQIFEKNLKKINDLGLEIAPKYVKTITKDNDMFIINQIKGTKSGNLIPYEIAKKQVSDEDKQKAYLDMQKLTKSGLVDDKIARSSAMWFVSPDDNKIVLPSFEALRNLKTGENKEVLNRYYNIIFG